MNVLMGVIFLADFIYLFAFIHKVRLCRRAPGSGLNVRLSVPGRTEEFLPKIRKLDSRIPPSALLPPHLPFPTPQRCPGAWMAGPGWVNRNKDSRDSPGCSSVPFCIAGKNSAAIWKYQSELMTSWEMAEDITDPFSGGHMTPVHYCL